MKQILAKLIVYPQYQDDSFDKAANTHRFYGEHAQEKALVRAQEYQGTNKRVFLKVEYKLQ